MLNYDWNEHHQCEAHRPQIILIMEKNTLNLREISIDKVITELRSQKKNQEQFSDDFGSFQNGIFNKWYD